MLLCQIPTISPSNAGAGGGGGGDVIDRCIISKDTALEAAIQDPMAAPMAFVGHRFQCMKIKENS